MSTKELLSKITELDKSLINIVSENYIKLKLDYSNSLIIPMNEADALIRILGKSLLHTSTYGENPRITGLDADTLQFSIMSADEFKAIRIAQLLNASHKDVTRALKGDITDDTE